MATDLEVIKGDCLKIAKEATTRDEAAELLAQAIQKAIQSAEVSVEVVGGSSSGMYKGKLE